MGFKSNFPNIPYNFTTPPPDDILDIANKVVIRRFGYPAVSGAIAAAADDSCKSSGGVFNNAAPDCNIGKYNSISMHSAFRFTGITIPAGAVITAAYITIKAQYTRSGQSALGKIWGEDVAAPAQFGAAEDFTARTLTAASVDWNPAAAWVAESTYDSPDLSTIVQELLDSYDFDNGVMSFIWLDNGTAGAYNFQGGYSFDGDAAKTAVLTIEYAIPLTNHYLFQYLHLPDNPAGYLFTCLLDEENTEALFSVNDYAIRGIEITRLAAVKLEAYYNDVLQATFPVAVDLTVTDGYYNLSPIP